MPDTEAKVSKAQAERERRQLIERWIYANREKLILEYVPRREAALVCSASLGLGNSSRDDPVRRRRCSAVLIGKLAEEMWKRGELPENWSGAERFKTQDTFSGRMWYILAARIRKNLDEVKRMPSARAVAAKVGFISPWVAKRLLKDFGIDKPLLAEWRDIAQEPAARAA